MAVASTHSPDRCAYCTLLFDASNCKTHSGKIGKRIVSTRPSTCGFVKSGLSAHFAPFFSLVSWKGFPQVVVVSRDTHVPGFVRLGKVREMLLIQYFICVDIEKAPPPRLGKGPRRSMERASLSSAMPSASEGHPSQLEDRFCRAVIATLLFSGKVAKPFDLPAYLHRAHNGEAPNEACRRAGTFVL